MKEEDKPSVTPEEIQRFKQLQKLQRMLHLAKISREREAELTLFANELIQVGNNKDQIQQILTIRENLSPDEQKALQVILMGIL
jgi:hypothetical protein